MDTLIADKFARMGARVRVTELPEVARTFRDWRTGQVRNQRHRSVQIDIRHDGRGEFFDVVRREDVSVEVIDLQPKDRHLLLMVRQPRAGAQVKSKFLCGHDERSWFVAAIPEVPGVRDVATAKDALKPELVRDESASKGVRAKDRNRRRTDAFVRQGEWFFLPRPSFQASGLVFRDEPIRRGAGKPHICQFLCRTGGQQVYVNGRYPNGLTVTQFMKLPKEQRRKGAWRVMMRDAEAYVKGAIRHPDHATVVLPFWHLVQVNTESRATAMRHVAFLD